MKNNAPHSVRDRLRDALIALIHEKDYDAISVREILARAHVGRTAFYSHFDGKDDLLGSGIRRVLRSARRTGSPTWFSRPIFEYIARHRHPAGSRIPPTGRRLLHEHLRQTIADLIRDDVRQCSLSPELAAGHVASTFVLVLNWWVDSASALSAADVDAIFQSLVAAVIAR